MESKILKLLNQGKSIHYICNELGCNVYTVRKVREKHGFVKRTSTEYSRCPLPEPLFVDEWNKAVNKLKGVYW